MWRKNGNRPVSYMKIEEKGCGRIISSPTDLNLVRFYIEGFQRSVFSPSATLPRATFLSEEGCARYAEAEPCPLSHCVTALPRGEPEKASPFGRGGAKRRRGLLRCNRRGEAVGRGNHVIYRICTFRLGASLKLFSPLGGMACGTSHRLGTDTKIVSLLGGLVCATTRRVRIVRRCRCWMIRRTDRRG